MEIIKIKNTTDRTYRFSSTVEFKAGEITSIAKAEIECRPAIGKLIERGDLKVVTNKGDKKHKEDEEIIEE